MIIKHVKRDTSYPQTTRKTLTKSSAVTGPDSPLVNAEDRSQSSLFKQFPSLYNAFFLQLISHSFGINLPLLCMYEELGVSKNLGRAKWQNLHMGSHQSEEDPL